MQHKAIQWVGCFFGVLGAGLLAANNEYAGWGFVAFLASNVAWITYGFLTRAAGLLLQQVAFTGTSLYGIWTWLIRLPV